MDLLNLAQVVLFVQTFFWVAAGKSPYQAAEIYLPKMTQSADTEQIIAMMPILKYLYLLLTFGRLALIAVSYKYDRVSKYYFAYQMLFCCVEATFPQNFGDFQIHLALACSYLFYIAFAYNFWSNILCAVLMHAYISFFALSQIHGKEVPLEMFAARTFWQILLTILVHCLTAICGQLYSETEILRKDNERLLENHSESVVILEEPSGKVTFANTAAKTFGAVKLSSKSEDDSPSSSETYQLCPSTC